ncbi:Beta-glucan synthesis-associated protein [Podosphaera aphanis]|nr:Beta-glucan synthesis-associated protein [Podosphaera aphanis]
MSSAVKTVNCETPGVEKEIPLRAVKSEPALPAWRKNTCTQLFKANSVSTRPSHTSTVFYASNLVASSLPLKVPNLHYNLNSQASKPKENHPAQKNTENVEAITRSVSSPSLPGVFHSLVQKKSDSALSSGENPRFNYSSSSLQESKCLIDLDCYYSRYPPSRVKWKEKVTYPTATVSASYNYSADRSQSNNSKTKIKNHGLPDYSISALNPYVGKDKSFILYTGEIEADDKFHTPLDDDDITFKPKLSEYFDRQSLVSIVGGVFLILGLLCVFIVFPVLSFATDAFLPSKNQETRDPRWLFVNDRDYPLLENVRTGLIDPDTPLNAKTRTSAIDGSSLNLVFSDEFNEDNRTFYHGDDPFWTAADIWYGATQDLEWYDPDAITTSGGTLQLKMDLFLNNNLQYRSGMLNSWNQLCFKGGVIEVSVSLAGPSGVPGLWPGVWTMGNLGRSGYLATTDGVWPYTYNTCDLGITPNQSDPSGISYLPGQRLNSCTCKGEDHPNPGTGRGAPEIDVLEASVDQNNRIGVVTQSFQVAPFDVFHQPNAEFMAIPNFETTQINPYTGGPYQQAVSGTSLLNNDWYDGLAYQKYAFEYIPGASKGQIVWFVGEDPTFMMDGRAIGPNGNIAARLVSQEPMSVILNLGMSSSWTQISHDNLKFPTVMHVDYVRLYQRSGKTSVTCDPPGYPTTDFIKSHPLAYQNQNMTKWDDTGYMWPRNKIQSGC